MRKSIKVLLRTYTLTGVLQYLNSVYCFQLENRRDIMKLQRPKNVTFYIAVLLGLLGLIGQLGAVGALSAYAFWLVFVGLVLLVLGVLFDGI